MANEYTALRGILAPGTSVYGYHRGHPVTASVVDSWSLTVGTANDPDADVVEGNLPADEVVVAPVPRRPTEADNRAAWESWAIANGMDAQQAAEASQEDLEAVGGTEPGTEQGDRPARPADTAKKAEWQAYAARMGADETWAYADTTTKADLQAYAPQPGDTVAVAATEASQG
jgi:hypothetical protein